MRLKKGETVDEVATNFKVSTRRIEQLENSITQRLNEGKKGAEQNQRKKYQDSTHSLERGKVYE